MNRTLLKIFLPAFALLFTGLNAAPTLAAAPVSVSLGSITHHPGGNYLDLPISINSEDQAINSITVGLTLPSNLALVDSTFDGSVFGHEATSPVQKGSSVRFKRDRNDSGFKGIGGLIGVIELKPLSKGEAVVLLDPNTTQAGIFSPIKNIPTLAIGTSKYTIANEDLLQPLSTVKSVGPPPTSDPRMNMEEGGIFTAPTLTRSVLFNVHDPLDWVRYGSLVLAIILLLLVVRLLVRSQNVSGLIRSMPRSAILLVVASMSCLALSGVASVISKQQAHADFLNPGLGLILPPTNVSSSAVITNNVSVSSFGWTPAVNAVSYNVYAYDVKIASALTTNSYSALTSTLNGSATYTVTSVNAAGQESIPSNLTNVVIAFTTATQPNWSPLTPPPVPLNVVATPQWNMGAPRISIYWKGDGGSPDYNVYRDGVQISKGMWDLTYFDSNVTPGSTHQYTVTSVNTYTAGNPESAQSVAVSATALSVAPAFSTVPINVTKVVPNDDSALVYFDTVPGAVDYRIYDRSKPSSAKYAGRREFNLDPAKYWGGKVAAPDTYAIEMNGLNPAGADLVVEAVDKFGPFQKTDGFMGPGANLGTSANGQGDPSDVPSVLAVSKPFHITMRPFALTGSQVFSDVFRGEQPLTPVANDPALEAAVKPSNYSDLKTISNNKWKVIEEASDTTMDRSFFMGNHFMDTIYDGPTYDKAPFSHNNNAVNVFQPNATADISNGKVLHMTMEVDGHETGRRWMDMIVTGAGDQLVKPEPLKVEKGYPTLSGNMFYWEILAGNFDVGLYKPDPANPGQTIKIDLNQFGDWGDGYSVHRTGGDAAVGINGTAQDLDKRHKYDLYLSQTHYKVIETAPNGDQIVREKDFPPGVTLPFTAVQGWYDHLIYHTSNDRGELLTWSPGGSYWYNYRPWSDERHWDNMGFEVLPSVAVIPTSASLVATSFPPDYQGVGNPTPTPSASPSSSTVPTSAPTPTPTAVGSLPFDLNGDGKVTLADIILTIRAYNGTPNSAAALIWPPNGNPGLSGLVSVIRAFNDSSSK